MEEEIDLRQYIRVLIRPWYWIAGLGLAAAVVAFLVSSFLPPTYEASALVAIAEPSYELQFDARLRDVPFNPTRLSKSYPMIATSDDLLINVTDAAGGLLPSGRSSLNGIKDMLDAKATDDPYLVQLTVRAEDPQLAADLVNLWAEQYVSYLNKLYGEGDSLSMFEAQLVEAKSQVEQADQALAAFRSEYGLEFLGVGDFEVTDEGPDTISIGRQLQARTRLLSKYEARASLLSSYEARASQVGQLLEEARGLAAQTDSETSPAVLAGLLAEMLDLGLLEDQSSMLVQISLGDLDVETGLSALVTALEAKQNATDETIDQLEAEVQSLQAEVSSNQQELEQLLRDQQVAQDTYLALSNKVQEVKIQGQGDIGDIAQLVSRAAVPQEPTGPRRLFNTVIAGVLGLIVGACAALFSDYWRQGASQPPTGGQEPSQPVASTGRR